MKTIEAPHERTDAATALTGDRTFTWFAPKKRKPSEYELFTVGLQSTPEQWMHVGWPVCFEDGTPPWTEDASKIRAACLADYRDPAQLWQRHYVDEANQQQQTLERLVPVLTGRANESLDTQWREQVLQKSYAAWPYVEYGLFRALSYAVRQCRVDTIEFMLAFQVFDHLRLQQDIVQHLFRLSEDVTGFSDQDAHSAWMNDPALVAVRELVEAIIGLDDWFETIVAINLVFEPLVGRLAKEQLFTRYASIHGDSATPLVLGQARLDTQRSAQAVLALVELVCADPERGDQNAATIAEWVSQWQPRCEKAANQFCELFAFTREGAGALERTQAEYRSLIDNSRLAQS
jgi:hypothetical protein